MGDIKKTNRSEQLTKYLDKPELSWLIALTLVSIPPVGVYLTVRHRRNWLDKPLKILGAVAWLTVWSIYVAVDSYKPEQFTGIYTGSKIIIETNREMVNELPSVDSEENILTNENATAPVNGQKEQDTDAGDSQNNQAESTGGNESTVSSQLTVAGVMAGIVMAPSENAPYSRDDYQPDWDVETGCDIRSRILSESSQVPVTFGANGCTVKNGQWYDLYTGQTLSGNPYRGDGTANDLDIDHIIPLKYVNDHGGAHWSAEKKRSYGASLEAMNNGVYVAVLASENREKSDSGPSEYYPPNPDYRCEYSRKWRDIARIYGISLNPADYNLIANILIACGIN